MGPFFFDIVEELTLTCPDGLENYGYEFIYKRIRTPLIIVTYASVGCLVVTLLFYIERPKKGTGQKQIDKWWKRGVCTVIQ